MAESDLSYTKAIMGGERYSYAGKNVLILGKTHAMWQLNRRGGFQKVGSMRRPVNEHTLLCRSADISPNCTMMCFAGGGDGGILHEVLKLNPAKVLMLELDEMVVNACRKHLRGVCHDSMDKLCGDNYEVGARGF